ncbi:hypothetical protein WJX72_005915 [[Myrmecia] bisecta]|uniref:AP2/ERF domain-containing protein n=1 Tax=[Myrmecia] bisecta TaxID=41462 RepID=A0AAW1R7B7_9CHLO
MDFVNSDPHSYDAQHGSVLSFPMTAFLADSPSKLAVATVSTALGQENDPPTVETRTAFEPKDVRMSLPALPEQPVQVHQPPVATKSSQFRGVYRRKRGGRWEASIVIDGKNCRLGLHATEEAAARAYDRVAIRKWGIAFAADKLNFPPEQYDVAALEAETLDAVVQTVRGPVARGKRKAGPPSPLGLAPQARAAGSGLSQDAIFDSSQFLSMDPATSFADDVTADPPPQPTRRRRGEAPQDPLPRIEVLQSSRFRGVSLHKQSQKWVAQIKAGGKQIYLGFFTNPAEAARAYDQAAINTQGESAITNYPVSDYAGRLEQLRSTSLTALVKQLKAEARGGVPRAERQPPSKFRGVAQDKHGKFRASIALAPKNVVYLGTCQTEDGAARTYDRACISVRGDESSLNFPISDYAADVEVLQSTEFPVLAERQPGHHAGEAQRAQHAQHDEHAAPGPSMALFRPDSGSYVVEAANVPASLRRHAHDLPAALRHGHHSMGLGLRVDLDEIAQQPHDVSPAYSHHFAEGVGRTPGYLSGMEFLSSPTSGAPLPPLPHPDDTATPFSAMLQPFLQQAGT